MRIADSASFANCAFVSSEFISKLFQKPHVVFVEEADVVDAAQLRQERHLCSQHATNRPSPVGAAYSANRNFLTDVVHLFSMSLLTELKNLSGFISTKISLLTELSFCSPY